MNIKLGMYNNCVIRKDSRVPYGLNAGTSAAITTTRRSIFCGAQAACISFGQDGGPNKFSWVEELFDWNCGPSGSNTGCKVGELGETLEVSLN